ncbi:SAM domain-containing protein SAMSN-1b isoform X1, partial [Tachysurus ichikawai]
SRTSELTCIGDKTPSSNVYCPCTGKRDDLVHHTAEDTSEDPYMMNSLAQEERIERNGSDYDVQVVKDKSCLHKIQKPLKSSIEESRYPPDISGLSKKPETKQVEQFNQQSDPGNERDIRETEGLWNPGHFHNHWSSTDACSFWELSYHTCHRPTANPWLHNVNFTLPRGTDRHRYEELIHDLDLLRMEYPPLRVIRSFTDLDMTDTVSRSYSFGRFDTSKNQSKLEEHEGALGQAADGDPAEGEHIKGGLGKKMKAISMTMRKKMGKKYTRALSEETGDGVDGDQEAERQSNVTEAPAKAHTKSSNSVESLFSLHSGQSSSSGITSGSEGSFNRDSLRLEEEVPETIHFCGKAKVHTDFLPSPYDTESLKLKVGDVIDVISKSPMGIWTGMLNGKVGSFKFIYVDVLAEEPAPVHRMGIHRRSRRPRPKTLQEFLERLNLEEFVSSLLLNGYQTVEDLKDLKEQHLIELNVTNPEHRHKLLAAAEYLHDAE